MKTGHDDHEPLKPHPDIDQETEDEYHCNTRSDSPEPEELRDKHIATDHRPISPGEGAERPVQEDELLVRIARIMSHEELGAVGERDDAAVQKDQLAHHFDMTHGDVILEVHNRAGDNHQREHHRHPRENSSGDEIGREDSGVPAGNHRGGKIPAHNGVHRNHQRRGETGQQHVDGLIALPGSERSVPAEAEKLEKAATQSRARPGLRRRLFEFFSLGWDGSFRTWQRYETVYMLLAGLATPLVVSVHTIVSWDFAAAVIPGWHATIFPPYFVAGAIFSGMAMVLTLMIVARTVMNLQNYITVRHVEVMCKLILLNGSIVALAYGTEFFMAHYSGNPYEQFVFLNRAFGPFAWAYWTMISCNVLIPQLLWFRRVRTSIAVVFVLSLLINVGMWFERFVIIVTSLHRDFLPSNWASYRPTSIEVATLLGSFGLFFTCFLIFCRILPMIAMAEVKGVVAHERAERRHHK